MGGGGTRSICSGVRRLQRGSIGGVRYRRVLILTYYGTQDAYGQMRCFIGVLRCIWRQVSSILWWRVCITGLINWRWDWRLDVHPVRCIVKAVLQVHTQYHCRFEDLLSNTLYRFSFALRLTQRVARVTAAMLMATRTVMATAHR